MPKSEASRKGEVSKKGGGPQKVDNGPVAGVVVKRHLAYPVVEATSDAVLLGVLMVHALACPYTKVEESFNMQAVHDLLVHGADLSSYDHIMFPGVVPRTFLGPMAVAALASPLHHFIRKGPFADLGGLLLIRVTLAVMSFWCFRRLRRAVHARAGVVGGVLFALLLASQFHLPFYSSRPLGNTFALHVVAVALGNYLEGSRGVRATVRNLSLVAAIFRWEVALWLVCVSLEQLVSAGRRAAPHRVLSLVGCVLSALVPCVVLSVTVDSAMWSGTAYMEKLPLLGMQWIWPELACFRFNGMDNRSSEWGVMPWHWYVSSALPRSVPVSLLAVGFGVAASKEKRRLLREVLVWTSPLAVFSLLPHKELRFVFPSLLALTVFGAVGMAEVFGRSGRVGRAMMTLVVLASVVACAAASGARLAASIYNYPGGHALWALGEHLAGQPIGPHVHPVLPSPVLGGEVLLNFTALAPWSVEIDDDDLTVLDGLQSWGARPEQGTCTVHVDPHSAMSGVTRFVHPRRCEVWKTEYEDGTDVAAALREGGFDFALSAERKLQGFDAISAVLAFKRFEVRPLLRGEMPKMFVRPDVFIHQRNRQADDA